MKRIAYITTSHARGLPQKIGNDAWELHVKCFRAGFQCLEGLKWDVVIIDHNALWEMSRDASWWGVIMTHSDKVVIL